MFLVCGEALFDVFATVGADGALALEPVAGGSPFNVAIGLARLGQATGFLGSLSTDFLGERLMARLQHEGVNTAHVVRHSCPTRLSLVGQDAAGQPAYTFYGAQAADISLGLADLPAPGRVLGGLHVGSYTLVMRPVADALAALCLREQHRFITLDPNVRLTVEPDAEIWRGRLAQTLPLVSVVKVSEEDIGLLWPGADPVAVAQGWLGRDAASGPALVMLTRGARGAIALTRQHQVDIEAQPVTLADTVGAGDAFQAALIDGLLRAGLTTRASLASMEQPALVTLLQRCIRVASLTCQRRGADLPRTNELDPPERRNPP